MNPRLDLAHRARCFARLAGAAVTALALVATPAAARADAELPDPVLFGVTVEAGNLNRAREWLEAGLPPDFLADRIGTGLMIAAWEGNIPMMALFLAHGADVNATNALREQAIMHAAWRGRTDAVLWLLARGAQVNRGGLAWSALHYAAFAGQRRTLEALLRHGADINARSSNGSSPLMMAAREGHEEVVGVLLGAGADTGIRNDQGDDALAWAMRNKHTRIGKMVAQPEAFAAAARAPEQFGPPTRSLPASERLESLHRRMREAQALGYLTDDLEREYAQALREMREQWSAEAAATAAARRNTPSALEIRARRDAPGREDARLIYRRDAGRTPATSPPGAAGP